MSAVDNMPIEPVKRTPIWLRLVGRPRYRRWVWTWMGWGTTDGYWEYQRPYGSRFGDQPIPNETTYYGYRPAEDITRDLAHRSTQTLPQLHGWQFQPDEDAPGLYLQCVSPAQREMIMRALGWYPGCPEYRSDTTNGLQSA